MLPRFWLAFAWIFHDFSYVYSVHLMTYLFALYTKIASRLL
jgi:hypothetical protein